MTTTRTIEQIPVVVLTAAATATLPMKEARIGCAAYMLKRCYPDQLIASIRDTLATA